MEVADEQMDCSSARHRNQYRQTGGIVFALCRAMRFYRINTRNEVSGPLTAEELARKYKRHAIDKNTPCQSTETRVWQTIGHYFPGFELGNFRPMSIEDRRASRAVSPLAWLSFAVLIAAAAVTAWWNLRGLPDSGRSVTADSFPRYGAMQSAPQLYSMQTLQQSAPSARQETMIPAQPLYQISPAPRPTPKDAPRTDVSQRTPSPRRTVVNASELRRKPVPTYIPPSVPCGSSFRCLIENRSIWPRSVARTKSSPYPQKKRSMYGLRSTQPTIG